MDKAFAPADVKAAGDGGEFEAVASLPALDRDGEVIDAGAFEPLPESVPIHAYHSFSEPVGVGQPYYEGETLMVRGTFATTPRAQEMRQLVVDGAVPAVSVGFITRNSNDVDGVRHITDAELLEVSLVSVPALREAQILAVKSVDMELKAGARNSGKDAERLQTIHDLAVDNGAVCKTAADDGEKTSTTDEEEATGKSAAATDEAAVTLEQAADTEDGDEGTDLELRLRALELLVEATP